jgi:predicted dienelactone hydrolase
MTRSSRRIAGFLLAAFLTSGCGDSDTLIQPTAAPLTSAAVLQPGPFGVGVTTMTFVDTSRPTMPNGTFAGAPSRTLVTEIWYPIAPQSSTSAQETRNAPLTLSGAPYPLVVYSHGFMSVRTGGAYLARHLISYGYVVAAPEFPLSKSGAPGGPTSLDLGNQAGDVHFVIDQLLALSADAQSPLQGSVDRERIGLTGLSLGGSTTFLAAFHPTLRDPRVHAAAPTAGGACFFGPDFYAQTRVPLLILHGDIDAIVPYQANAVFAFGEAPPPKYLVTIAGGSHTAFVDGAEIFDGANNPDDIGCGALRRPSDGASDDDASPSLVDRLGGPAAGIIDGICPPGCPENTHLPRSIRPRRQHQLTILSIFPFFEAYLRGDTRAQEFLEQTLAAENSDVTTQLQVAGN